MPSYIEQSLIKNEVILREVKHHWSAWVPFWIWVILALPTIGITLILALISYIRLKSIERAVTNRRVIQKKGFISRRTDEMKLTSIETVELTQTILDRIFGAGSIRVTGRGISDVEMKHIENPAETKKAIEEAEDWEPETEPASAPESA